MLDRVNTDADRHGGTHIDNRVDRPPTPTWTGVASASAEAESTADRDRPPLAPNVPPGTLVACGGHAGAVQPLAPGMVVKRVSEAEAKAYRLCGTALHGVVADHYSAETAADHSPGLAEALQRRAAELGVAPQSLMAFEDLRGDIPPANLVMADVKIGPHTAYSKELASRGLGPIPAGFKALRHTVMDSLRGTGPDRPYTLSGGMVAGAPLQGSRHSLGAHTDEHLAALAERIPAEHRGQVLTRWMQDIHEMARRLDTFGTSFVGSSVLFTTDTARPDKSRAHLIDLAHPVTWQDAGYQKVQFGFQHGADALSRRLGSLIPA